MKFNVLKFCLLAIIILSPSACSRTASPVDQRSDTAYQLPIPLEGSLQNPAWSPDGKAIVFTRFRNGYNQGPADLVVYDIESKTARILVSDNTDNVNLPGSAWDANTNQIIFSSSRPPHDEIYAVDADARPGAEMILTSRVDQVAYEPSFSPDGLWIVFETHEVDVAEHGIITRYKIDGTEPYQALTGANKDCRQPNWSPAGNFIVFQAWKDEQWDIWIMKVDGASQRQITRGPGDKTDASFSPDGQWIIYSAELPTMEYANLFIIPLSGGDPKQVTESDGYDGAPSWSLNGDQIVFESSVGDPEDGTGTTIWMIDFH